MKNSYDLDDLQSRINEKLASYSRDAGSYLKKNGHRSGTRLIGRGVLASVIPLVAATGAQAQCQSSIVVDVYDAFGSPAAVTTVSFGAGLSLQFRYSSFVGGGPVSMRVVSGIVQAASSGATMVKRSTSFSSTAPIPGTTGFGLLAEPPFGLFHTSGGFVLIEAGGIPGWLELSNVARVGSIPGHVQLTILDGGLEEDADGFVHTGDCSTLEINLPVELTSFTALLHESDVVLSWETASELNNAGFEVQRSTSGRGFRKIGFLEGSGTTTEPNTYRFTDEGVEPNVHYRYRLKQIDLDGVTSFSDIVEVFTEDPSQIALSEFYPNPVANGRASLNVNVADASEARVSVFDTRGALVRSNVEMLNAGQNRLSFHTDGLAAGPHFAKVQIGERVQYRQFVVAR